MIKRLQTLGSSSGVRFRLVVGLALLAHVIGLSVAGRLGSARLVQARFVLFTDYYSERELDQGRLDRLVEPTLVGLSAAQLGRLDSYLSAERLRALRALPSQSSMSKDATLARAIAFGISAGPSTGGCGEIEPLREKVAGVERRYGCCSDYDRAFIAYALALGLNAREVHNRLHSTVEYYDRDQREWIWIDPSFGVQAVDESGRRLGHWEIRRRSQAGERLAFETLNGAEVRDPRVSRTYAASAYDVAYWSIGNDLEGDERLDARLRRFVPFRTLRRIVEWFFGGRGRYIAVATGDVGQLRFVSWAFRLALAAIVCGDLALSLWAIAAVRRRLITHAVRSGNAPTR